MKDLQETNANETVKTFKEKAILASIGVGLIAIDRKGKVMMVNKAGERMLGWKNKELLGRTITNLPLEDEKGNILIDTRRPYKKVISKGKIIKRKYFIVRKDKTRFPIQATVTPIKQGKKIVGAVDIFYDITREREAARIKDEFISLVSHQLRTPVGIAEWYLEAIKRERLLDNVSKTTRDYLNEVYKTNKRLRVLVKNLLLVSEADQVKVRNVPETIGIVPFIKDIISCMNILAAKNKVTIRVYKKKASIPPICIDRLRFQEIIENLIANAITYSHSGGKVEVIVDTQAGNLLIAVKDTGIGISKVDKKRLFTKFFRSEKAIKKNTEGSGLGLYLVQFYIKELNGSISVETVEEKGSTFTVLLPLKGGKKKVRE